MKLETYIDMRMAELAAFKSVALEELQAMQKSSHELNFDDRKELTSKKMQLYIAAGALAELEVIKKIIEG